MIRDHELVDQLIEKGLKNVQRFKLEKIAESYAEVYTKVLG